MSVFLAPGTPITSGRMVALICIVVPQTILATILVSLRVWDALRTRAGIKMDLWLAIIALWLQLTEEIFPGLVSGFNGLGFHIQDLTNPQRANTIMWAWMGIEIAIYSLCFGKLSIISMYLQVTHKGRKEMYFLLAASALIIATTFVQSAFSLSACQPMERLWSVQGSKQCRGAFLAGNFAYFHAAFLALVDLVLSAWPMIIVARMKASRKTKIEVCLIMAGGSIPIAASICRCVFLKALYHVDDFTYDVVPMFASAMTEQWFVLILGSLFPLRCWYVRTYRGKSLPIAKAAAARPRSPSPEPIAMQETMIGAGAKASPWPFGELPSIPLSPTKWGTAMHSVFRDRRALFTFGTGMTVTVDECEVWDPRGPLVQQGA